MFDIRKIQEQVIYNAVKEQSDDKTAQEIVYGENGGSLSESNAEWVKSSMRRLEKGFSSDEVKRIRMNCQCGYGMDEKLKLLEEIIESSSCFEEFAANEKARDAGMFLEEK